MRFRRRKRRPPSPLKGRTFPPEVLTRPELDALLAAVNGPRMTSVRNHALVVVLWRSGLRIAEALALMPYDIDLKARTVRVRHGKGDKARTVGLDAHGAQVIGSWLERRAAWAPAGPVFCTSAGKELHDTYVRAMLERAAARAGIARRVHPHMLRHTYAVELVQEGVPVPHIQRMLGHSSLATTATYLASLSPEEALDHVRSREW